MASLGSWMSSIFKGFLIIAKHLVNYRFLSVLSALQLVVTLPVNLPFIYITSHLEHFSQRRYHETLIKKSLWIIICDGSGKMFDKRLQDPVSLFNGGDFVYQRRQICSNLVWFFVFMYKELGRCSLKPSKRRYKYGR